MAKMPCDRDGQPIPTLIGSKSRANLTAGAASSSAALPTNDGYVMITCTDAVWFNTGAGAATASAATTSALLVAGVTLYAIPTGHTYGAVLRAGSSDVPVQIEGLA